MASTGNRSAAAQASRPLQGRSAPATGAWRERGGPGTRGGREARHDERRRPLSPRLSVSQSVSQSVSLSVSLSVCLSVCLSLAEPAFAVDVAGRVEALGLDPDPPVNLPYTGPASVAGPFPLEHATVTVNGNSALSAETAADGTFSIPTAIGAGQVVTVTVRLEKGSTPAIEVLHDPDPAQTLSLTWTQTAGSAFDFVAANGRAFNLGASEAATAQVSSFVYAGIAAEFATEAASAWSPAYAPPPLTIYANRAFSLPCDVGLGGYSAPFWFFFTSAARTCGGGDPALLRNCTVSSIVLHEYLHHFTQNLWQPGALHTYTDEIFADVFAAYLTGDPVIGRDIFGAGEHRRDISELWIHPVTGTDDPLHDAGRPHSGAMWELREALMASEGATAGAETAMELLFEWIRQFRTYGTLPPPNEVLLREVLEADDALYDPGGGFAPPHGELIAEAFGHHGLLVPFVRGDANSDAFLDVSDSITILLYLFSGGSLSCRDAADVNDDGAVDVSDSVSLLDFLYEAGPAPPSPYPDCGTDAYDSDEIFCVASGCVSS